MNKTKAFTLIELLVVIAIIAILAAILFPVFAQAKEAAKKTQGIAQYKQVGTAAQIYLADYDDKFPGAFGYFPGVGHMWLYGHDTPADWYPGLSANYLNFARGSWANSIQPYMKNYQLYEAPGAPNLNLFGDDFSIAQKQVANVNTAMNGLLHNYSATAIAAPSQLPLFTQSNGKVNFQGYAYSNPYLQCDNPNAPCAYVPSSPTCGANNGEYSGLFTPEASMWVYSNGLIVTHADTSTKFRRVGANVNGRTDFRTDFYSRYDSSGKPAAQWQDSNFCHALLFQPDFDFTNYGTPIEWQ